ncbi:MAG: 30S ribosome-binding factor RbfA [Anaerolineaceae bacterium]|nr:30S ribosome-binding factor RbfA [Anaerolineaceae bacterium]
MPSGIRLQRIQDQIRQVMTLLLETKVSDPRVQGAYITDVSVDRELDYANIYVSSLVGEEQAAEILDGLRSAAGYLRYELGRAVKLRVMPKLRFYWDDTPEKADRIESLLAEIKKERLSNAKEAVENVETDNEELDDEGNQSQD